MCSRELAWGGQSAGDSSDGITNRWIDVRGDEASTDASRATAELYGDTSGLVELPEVLRAAAKYIQVLCGSLANQILRPGRLACSIDCG